MHQDVDKPYCRGYEVAPGGVIVKILFTSGFLVDDSRDHPIPKSIYFHLKTESRGLMISTLSVTLPVKNYDH